VYGGEGEQVGLYEKSSLTEPPVELLQDAWLAEFVTSGHSEPLLRSAATPALISPLTGHLYAFREVSTVVCRRLNFDVELNDLKLGKVIWHHTYNHDEPTSVKTGADVAAAID